MEPQRTATPSRADTLDALSILRRMQDQGVFFWVEAGQLRFRSPKGALAAEDLQRLRSCKGELIALLGGDESAAPLAHRSLQGAIPLTPLQQLAWEQLDRRGTWQRSHVFAFRIEGDLDVAALANALACITQRHTVLRTRLSMCNGVPLQSVSDCAVHEAEAELSLHELVESEIDLAGPLFESRLFRLDGDHYILALTLDQLITDCRSDELLSRQIWDEYLQPGSADPPGQLQFSDYALWLADLHSAWERVHGPYWQARFRALERPAPPAIPAALRSRRELAVGFDPQSTRELMAFARDLDVYPSLILLTAFFALASQVWQRRDIVIAAVDNGRHTAELQTVVGPLVNLLHLRIQVDPQRSFADLLQEVATGLQEAHQHRDYNWLRSLVPGVATELFFNWITYGGFEPIPAQALEARAGIRVRPCPPQRLGLPPAPVGLTIRHTDSLSGSLSYTTDVLTDDEASELIGQLHAVCGGAVRQPQATIADLSSGVTLS
jgi:hypothetical protein